MKILVSACLLGENCKYNGKNNYNEKVAEFVQNKEIIPICQEMLAGMPSPRPCVELVHGAVVDENGVNVDEIYRSGVRRRLRRLRGRGLIWQFFSQEVLPAASDRFMTEASADVS